MLDETTYYFTAFAIDQNNNIIDSETLSITTDFGWHVTPNTLAYYKLEEDTKDYSNNHFDGTGGSISYTTLSTGKKVGVFNSNGVILPSFGNTAYQTITLSFWVKSNSSSSIIRWMFLKNNSSNQSFAPRQNNNTGRILTYDGSSEHQVNIGQTNNAWHHVCAILDNGTLYGFLDGIYAGSTSSGISSLICDTNGIGREPGTTAFAFSGQMSEVIIEKIGWTQAGLTKYVNKTKAQYGL